MLECGARTRRRSAVLDFIGRRWVILWSRRW
jgi:hypothetical protein